MWCYFRFLSIFVSFVTCYANESFTNRSTVIVGTDGIAVPIMEATIDLSVYENSTNLAAREDLPNWLTDIKVLPLANTTEMNSGSITIPVENLQKRTDMSECVWFALRSYSCAYEYWDIADGVWQAGYDIFRMTNAGKCAVVAGNKGSFYYKYYPNEPNCSSTIHQKTIAGALQQAIKQLEGDYLCNIYLFHVNHGGSWHGDIVVGGGVSTWFAGAKGVQYKGCIDAGCSGLQSPYSCSSQEEST